MDRRCWQRAGDYGLPLRDRSPSAARRSQRIRGGGSRATAVWNDEPVDDQLPATDQPPFYLQSTPPAHPSVVADVMAVRETMRTFSAMNTTVTAIVVVRSRQSSAAEGALEKVERFFSDAEACLSRFLARSELTALNRSAGTSFHASPMLFSVVEDAIEAAQETKGLFDPTVLPALIAAGYVRSFEEVE